MSEDGAMGLVEQSAMVKLPCQAFGISQTCYRYKAKLDAETTLSRNGWYG
jgi:hypothetical protein